MRMDKLTSRFQQALADAQSLAVGRDHQLLEPAHVMLALLDSSGRLGAPAADEGRRQRQQAARGAARHARPPAARSRARRATSTSPTISTACSTSPTSSRSSAATSSSPASCSCSRRFDDRGARRKLLQGRRRVRGAIEKAIDEVRGGEKVHDPNAEESRQALEKYTDRSHRARRVRQARSGHRPRRRDPPHHPGAAAAHQEQPGADRRARRRQDRDRRRARAAHRQRRSARGPARTSASWRSTWAR